MDKRIPVVGGPGLGAYFPLRRDPLDFFTQTARTRGDVAAIQIGPRSFYLLSHPDIIEQVLVSHSQKFIKGRGLAFTAQVLGNGLLTSDGSAWQRQRRLAQPAFHRRRIEQYARSMISLTQERIATWQEGEVRDLAAEMAELALAIVSQTLFSVGMKAEAAEVPKDVTTVMRYVNRRVRALVPFPPSFPTPGALRYRHALQRLNQLIFRIIAERESGQDSADDLLSMLSGARDDTDSSAFSPEQLRDEAMTILIAGHETTANALTWTWHLISRHPAVEDRLQDEWETVLAGGLPSADRLRELPYTEAVISESLRLYPPAWLTVRQAIEPVELGGYHFAALSQFVISQWVVQRDPRFFSDPDGFHPERWLPPATAKVPPMAYFPFGGGPRVCIGRAFAMTELKLLLVTIGRQFQFRPLAEHRAVPEALIGLRPKYGMPMRIQRRKCVST